MGMRRIDDLTSVFMSYSHEDEELRNQLEKHLTMLKREGAIDVWYDRRIVPGDEIDPTISDTLEHAQVILLLVSPDFLASDYCYDKEMERAMERHEAGEARVLPVILRHCDWQYAPFGKLLATPPDGKPVTKWADIDEAFFHVTQDIRRAIEATAATDSPKSLRAVRAQAAPSGEAPQPSRPRSSKLRVRKSFTEAEKDRFLDEAFKYMANFFENSLDELEKRNSDIETSFRRVDVRQFTAVIYRSGTAESRCRIFQGGLGSRMDSILYSMHDSPDNSSFNESLSVEGGDQMLFLRPLGIGSRSGAGEEKQLTFEGAAELYWGMFIEPLQS